MGVVQLDLMGKWGSSQGSSLVEAMIAVTILGTVAVAVYPIMNASRKLVNHADFYGLCINAARAKMNEYRYGTRTWLPGVNPNLTGDTGLNDTSATGFSYAKAQYNSENTAYCPRQVAGTTQALNVTELHPGTASLANLGREECIVGTGGALPVTCNAAISELDGQMQTNTRGRFRLFVNLRRYNPVIVDAALTPTEDCAWHATTGSYDFQNAGDMIKVTVTGVVDLQANETYAGITATGAGTGPRMNELTCQITDYVMPPNQVARYWLQYDGRIYRWLGTGVSGGQWEVFRSLASPGNRAIAVSPDNRYIYILRPGKLIRYEQCEGDPIDCPTNPHAEWTVDNEIVSIAAKWVNTQTGAANHTPNDICGRPDLAQGLPVMFGLMADRQTVVCIDLASTAPLAPAGTANPTAAVTHYNGSPAGSMIPFVVPPNANRVHSIFMDHQGRNTYVVDLTCADYMNNNTTYCGGIYSANDRMMLYPFEVFNVRAIAFSK